MKINREFQDLRASVGGSVDWVLKRQVERDICLLCHQLASYGSIMATCIGARYTHCDIGVSRLAWT